MAGSGGLPRLYSTAFFLITGLFFVLTISGIDRSCLDAADSAYLISADAVSRGLMPYRDFLTAHPPALYILGAPLAWLELGTFPFRLASLLIMAGLGLAVWRLALKLSGNIGIALLAGVFTLFAPLGVFFSKLFIQDALVSLVAVLTIYLLISGSRRAVAGAGVLCVLGTLTKLTFLPLLAAFVIFVYLYRRDRLALFIKIAVAGSLAAALALQLAAGGAYFQDIIYSQASKGYSFTNLREGLYRIWQLDWPLLVAAVPGLWLAVEQLRQQRQRDRLFLLMGWLAAGLVILASLAAAGHDTNLFQLLEPAVALLAAWGIIGLAEKQRPVLVGAAVVFLLVAVVVLVEKDRSLISRTNADDVEAVVSEVENRSGGSDSLLVPGCYALEARRPVIRYFFDQFLWEQKYQRGDEDALKVYEGLAQDISSRVPPVVVFEDGSASLGILGPELESGYLPSFTSNQWPPVTLWLPAPPPERPAS